MDFGRITDTTVELAVDLVNTHDLEGDRLQTVDDLRAFLEQQTGWDLDGAEATATDLATVRAGRAALRTVFESDDRAVAAAVLNRLATDAAATPQLTAHDDGPWHLHFGRPGARLGDRLLGACAAALMMVSEEEDGERLGVCSSDDCRWVYVDTSKNRSRRHCGDTCTTRERVRAHRRRRAAAGGSGRS